MLETERLLLRKPRLEDADELLGTGGEAGDTDAIERWLSEWDANGIGYFAVVRDGGVLGRAGFHVWDSRTWTLGSYGTARGHAETELGWTLAREHWGHGYATEAARALRHWAHRERVISLIEPSNERSVRVAQRLGASPTETVTVSGAACVVWVHP
ncbi:MAG: GNAT family N-acetyltransferase [Gaiellaceae bacterium]